MNEKYFLSVILCYKLTIVFAESISFDSVSNWNNNFLNLFSFIWTLRKIGLARPRVDLIFCTYHYLIAKLVFPPLTNDFLAILYSFTNDRTANDPGPQISQWCFFFFYYNTNPKWNSIGDYILFVTQYMNVMRK